MLSRLHQYNDWANSQVLDLFEKLEEPLPYSCIRLISHIINAQSIWLSRIQSETTSLTPWVDHSLDACRNLHKLASEGFKLEIEKGDLERVIFYIRGEASYETSKMDIMLHVFNHGTYHRAQIAQDLRKNGLEPVNTDFITFVRHSPVD